MENRSQKSGVRSQKKKFNFFIQQSTIYNLKFTILGFLCSLVIAGCGKQTESDQIRRAQLVGNENLQLKKEIAAKDKQIADLKQEVEKAQAENAALQEQHGDIYKKLLDIISECQGKLDKYEGAADSNQLPAEPAKPELTIDN